MQVQLIGLCCFSSWLTANFDWLDGLPLASCIRAEMAERRTCSRQPGPREPDFDFISTQPCQAARSASPQPGLSANPGIQHMQSLHLADQAGLPSPNQSRSNWCRSCLIGQVSLTRPLGGHLRVFHSWRPVECVQAGRWQNTFESLVVASAK